MLDRGRWAAGVLVMGAGSTPERMRWVLLSLEQGRPRSEVADMTPLYAGVAEVLEVWRDVLNLEGACVLGRTFRWFQRGLPSAGQASASVDLDRVQVLATVHGRVDGGAVAVSGARRDDLGSVGNTGLAITDAVALPDQGVLCSAAAEESPNSRDDGPVVGSALVRFDEEGGVASPCCH